MQKKSELTSLISEPDFGLNLDRCCNFLRDPYFRWERIVYSMVVVSVSDTTLGVDGRFVGNGICACGPVTRGEGVLGKGGESGRREGREEVGHCVHRATDDLQLYRVW